MTDTGSAIDTDNADNSGTNNNAKKKKGSYKLMGTDFDFYIKCLEKVYTESGSHTIPKTGDAPAWNAFLTYLHAKFLLKPHSTSHKCREKDNLPPVV